ncbi:MAG: hypothetical protein J6S14_13390 [Clostridia bacterium]|nr:hypothetical protein [Clostridia bacterium]
MNRTQRLRLSKTHIVRCRGLQDSDGTAHTVTKATTGRGTNDTCVQSQVER